jgi:hypothetical protein
MANKHAANFPIPSATNVFQCIWKLTRCMKAAGWIYKASSNGTSKDTSGTASADYFGGNTDPMTDTYAAGSQVNDTNAGWEVLEGPDTLKIPLSAAPTGTFLRGEKITQATSSAEGELLGFVWDSVGGSGWMAVLPRTGTFNNSNVITGAISGATATPTGTIITWKREVMFYKPGSSNVLNGAIYYICADASAESAQLFSALATSSGCTATVGPGMGGTGNAFPSKGIVVRGNAGSTTPAAWFGNLTTGFQTNAEIAATNVTPATNVSADGTFYCVVSNSNAANSAAGFGLMRLDDTEPGDCEPFAFLTSGASQSFATWNNTATTSIGAPNYNFNWSNQLGAISFLGYQARGNGALDVVNAYRAMVNATGAATPSIFAAEVAVDLAKPVRIVNSPATTRPLVGELIGVVTAGLTSIANTVPQMKGRCRWFQAFAVGNTYDTFQNKTMLGVSVATTTAPCMAIGPFDGTTTPVQ